MFVMDKFRKGQASAIGLIWFLGMADGQQRDDFRILRQPKFPPHSLRVKPLCPPA